MNNKDRKLHESALQCEKTRRIYGCSEVGGKTMANLWGSLLDRRSP